MKLANQQNADKESCAEEAWLDDDKFGAEDKGRSEDHAFFDIDLKPVLPVALAVSTLIGGLSSHQSQLSLCVGADSDVTTTVKGANSHTCDRVPYRSCGSLDLLQWFMGLSWGAWRIVPLLILGKSKRRETAKHENWRCWWHGHRGGDAAACTQVVAIFPSYPPL